MTAGTLPERVVEPIRERIRDGLALAARRLGRPADDPSLSTIRDQAERALTEIGRLVRSGELRPAPPVRVSREASPLPPVEAEIRLGVFPVNGNPIHWGHLLSCLGAIAEHRLDLVAVVVQGRDARKRISAATERHRHEMARDVLALLAPLVVYSDIGLGNAFVGEDNLFRLLRLNARQRIHAHYLVGSDHYRRVDARGAPDTVARLEDNVSGRALGFDPEVHRLKLLVLERGVPHDDVETSLDVAFLPVALEASSTAIRKGELHLAPYQALRYLRRHRDYADQLGLGGRAVESDEAAS
ncbi:MAG: hypothetical protein EP329_00545 [Deltaproteobacteria bacterium]|nr:MAG: hypothetical protein EP329_00545 [Deltaproteobacteria bacterium]